MTRAKILETVACPKCKAEGGDWDGNNLVVYDDGVSVCYAGHGLNRQDRHLSFFTEKQAYQLSIPNCAVLKGFTNELYPEMVSYLTKFDVSMSEVIMHKLRLIKGGIVNINNKKVRVDGGIYVPCGDSFIIRRIGDRATSSKVINGPNVSHFVCYTESKKRLIVTEDVFSAISVRRTGATAFSILGTHLKEKARELLLKLVSEYDETIIWLDDDSAGRKGAQKLRKDFVNYSSNVKVVHSPKDPKYYNVKELEEFIYAA